MENSFPLMNAPPIPSGSWPVMLTPFSSDGSVDRAGLRALVDFYIDHGSAGLFATCLSSEIEELGRDEIVEIARSVVEDARGRVPVVAGAVLDGTLEEIVSLVKAVAATGPAAVVIAAGTLVPAEADESAWRQAFARLMAETPGVPLGIYECPWPNHRVLSPETMAWLAKTDRVVFHKDTACDAEEVRAKCAAVAGSGLAFFNADLTTFEASQRAGAAGYSGVGCNFAPDLLAAACAAPGDAGLKRLLARLNALIPPGYPANAKRFLALRGVPISELCRKNAVADEANLLQLEEFKHDLDQWNVARLVTASAA